jgi:hypothetical protein
MRRGHVLLAGLCLGKAAPDQCNSSDDSDGHGGIAQKGTTIVVDYFVSVLRHFIFLRLD